MHLRDGMDMVWMWYGYGMDVVCHVYLIASFLQCFQAFKW